MLKKCDLKAIGVAFVMEVACAQFFALPLPAIAVRATHRAALVGIIAMELCVREAFCGESGYHMCTRGRAAHVLRPTSITAGLQSRARI